MSIIIEKSFPGPSECAAFIVGLKLGDYNDWYKVKSVELLEKLMPSGLLHEMWVVTIEREYSGNDRDELVGRIGWKSVQEPEDIKSWLSYVQQLIGGKGEENERIYS